MVGFWGTIQANVHAGSVWVFASVLNHTCRYP
jgi:hypothetical protein